MTINTIDTETVKQSVDLRDYAGRYTALQRESAIELAGPCPKCGGLDRFHCQADWFFCRQCHPKPGDAIEFAMWLNGYAFKEAVAALTNTPAPATKRTPERKVQVQRPPDWQIDTDALAERAHWRLLDDEDESTIAARNYLDSRAIEPHTWIAFNLGFAPSVAIPGTKGKERAPALVMPWYKAGKVCAIRYRFLEKQGDHKQTALAGSNFAGSLYGGQALDTGIVGLSTLIICEGELNACSIWQVSRYTHLDVLSLGSESASITPAMIEHANKYATVIVWLDREDRAQAIVTAFSGAHGIKSPGGQDANDLLQSGTLGGFLAMHRFQAAKHRDEQERLLWDLSDAQAVWQNADQATRNVIAHLRKTLGMTV